MPYRFILENSDYSDFSSGRVFHSAPGQPAFPVRLASEMFARCLSLFRSGGKTGPLSIFDPCCGGAYHLSVLAYLYWSDIASIFASDADPDVLSTAWRNLELLYPAGLSRRRQEIQSLLDQYGKESHRQALASIQRLQEIQEVGLKKHAIMTDCFQANAFEPDRLQTHLTGQQFDLVFTDVPYGLHSHWQYPDQADPSGVPPLQRVLDNVTPFLSPGSLAAIASDKGQRAAHQRYMRVDHFQIGKRRIDILRFLG